jgi:hypothetical protein
MLAKKTSKNQVTLPKAIVEKIPSTEYFDVSVSGGGGDPQAGDDDGSG